MNVKLISITKSIIENKELTSEELLVYIARVSNPNNQLNTETSDKLINYMIKNKHWSPFDMVNLTFEIVTSKAISIQILRHWSIKPQEFSQRYSKIIDIEPIELRKQGLTNRQVGNEIFNPIIREGERGDANAVIKDTLKNIELIYNKLIDAGVAKECARMILPMATSTTLYLNGSLRSWITYLNQRLSKHTQKEHRIIAKLIALELVKHFPHTSKALNNFNEFNGEFL